MQQFRSGERRGWRRRGARPAVALCTAIVTMSGVGADIASSPVSAATVPHASAHGILRVGTLVPVLNTNPYPTSAPNVLWTPEVFDNLVQVDAHGKPIPDLATSWKVSRNDQTFVFNLRKGVRFSDGSLFTANTAAWNIKYASLSTTGAQIGSLLSGVTALAVNRYTLRLHFPQPAPATFSVLTQVMMAKPAASFTTSVIGTGPFQISALQAGQSMTLTRNPHYWDASKIKLKEIVLQYFSDANTMELALKSGAINFLNAWQESVPYSDLPSLKSSGFQLLDEAAPGDNELLVNTSSPPLSNHLVREALSYAFDRVAFAQIGFAGYARPTCDAFPNTSPAFSKSFNNSCKEDLSKAKQLLSEAGYSKGFSLPMTVEADTPWQTFAPVYQQTLAGLGIQLQLTVVPQAQLAAVVSGATFTGLCTHSYAFGALDPGLMMAAYPFHTSGNPSHFVSQTYVSLVQSAEATVNPEQRITNFRKVAAFINASDFLIPTVYPLYVYVANKSVSGFTVDQDTYPVFSYVTLG